MFKLFTQDILMFHFIIFLLFHIFASACFSMLPAQNKDQSIVIEISEPNSADPSVSHPQTEIRSTIPTSQEAILVTPPTQQETQDRLTLLEEAISSTSSSTSSPQPETPVRQEESFLSRTTANNTTLSSEPPNSFNLLKAEYQDALVSCIENLGYLIDFENRLKNSHSLSKYQQHLSLISDTLTRLHNSCKNLDVAYQNLIETYPNLQSLDHSSISLDFQDTQFGGSFPPSEEEHYQRLSYFYSQGDLHSRDLRHYYCYILALISAIGVIGFIIYAYS